MKKFCIVCHREFEVKCGIIKLCSKECRIARKDKTRQRYLPSKEQRHLYRIKYRIRAAQYIKKYRIKLQNKLRNNLGMRIHDAIKKNKKYHKTLELVGCSLEQLKQHLESRFKEGMNWTNYGNGWNGKGMQQWHIDHIKPCASFDLSKDEEQKKCFNYTNLQPLWATENLKKNDSIL